MRNTAFLVLGVALLVIQSNLFRLIGYLKHHDGVLGQFLGFFAATPSLLLPLVIFMGVHEYSIARGAALSFILGYLLDVFAGAPVGLFTFITVATFIVARAAGVRLAAQTLITKLGLAFVFSLAQGVLIIVLTAIFGNDPARPRALVVGVAPHAIVTAIIAPLVFAVAERIHAATINVPGAHEGGQR